MSVVITLALNGIPVPVELDADALAAIAAAANVADDPWPEWMNVDSVARYLDSSPERIRKLVARRQIPYAQDGHGCRLAFNRAAIDQWMHTQHHDPARDDGNVPCA